MKKEVKPPLLIAVAVVAVAVLGAVGFFALGGRIGPATEESLGIGQPVAPGELPEGVRYHDLGGSAGPDAAAGAAGQSAGGAPMGGNPGGPGR